jgi:hypothetical protein
VPDPCPGTTRTGCFRDGGCRRSHAADRVLLRAVHLWIQGAGVAPPGRVCRAPDGPNALRVPVARVPMDADPDPVAADRVGRAPARLHAVRAERAERANPRLARPGPGPSSVRWAAGPSSVHRLLRRTVRRRGTRAGSAGRLPEQACAGRARVDPVHEAPRRGPGVTAPGRRGPGATAPGRRSRPARSRSRAPMCPDAAVPRVACPGEPGLRLGHRGWTRRNSSSHRSHRRTAFPSAAGQRGLRGWRTPIGRTPPCPSPRRGRSCSRLRAP